MTYVPDKCREHSLRNERLIFFSIKFVLCVLVHEKDQNIQRVEF